MNYRDFTGSTHRVTLFALTIASTFLLTAPRSAAAAGGDFSNVDFAAAAPFTYDHLTGGGAYDDGTNGKSQDVVESLEGGDFACGDLVSYLFHFDVAAQPVDARQTIEFLAAFSADTTGQSGAAHVDVDSVRVNYGAVVAGDGPGGTDAGIRDDGGSTASLVSEYFYPAAGPFVSGNNLYAKVRVDDLEAGEQVVVRVDVRIGCKPYARPTGNLQAGLIDVKVVAPVTDTINAGNQTIPFKQIGDLAGADEPALHLYKTVTTEDGACPGVEQIQVIAGDTVKYCYVVVNSGTADALDVVLVDDNGTPALLADDFQVGLAGLADKDGDGLADDLASGATATGFKLVEADLRGGEVLTNLAKVTGIYGRAVFADQDTASVEVELPLASLSLVVTASFDPICGNEDDMDPLTVHPGAQVYFCYTVTNTGGAPVTDIAIVDSLYGDPIPVPGTIDLAPGESGTLVSSPVVIEQDSSDSAVAHGIASGSPVESGVDAASVLVDFSALSLSVKASLDPVCGNDDDTDLATVLAGTTVHFCYTVVNTGETDLSGLAVLDPLAGSVALYSGATLLLPGDPAVFLSGPVVIGEDTIHTATALATDEFGFPVESTPDDAAVDAIEPSLAIVKTVSLDGSCPGTEVLWVLSGTQVTWCYAVTNTGDTAVQGIRVTDGDVLLEVGTLEPGQTGLVSAPATIVEDSESTAIASGTDILLGSTVATDPDLASVFVVHPALTIAVTVSLDGSCPGVEIVNVLEETPVTWCFQVVNSGDVGISDITVADSAHGAIPGSIAHLEPGESAFLSLADVALYDLALNGQASGTADLVDVPVASGLDPAAVNVVYPGVNIDVTISLDGTCPGVDAVAEPSGTQIWYCYTVTNLGDEPLADATVTDSLLGEIGQTGALEPGGSIVLVSGPVALVEDRANEAVVSGSDLYGFPVTDVDTALADALFADLAVRKTAPAKLLTTVGNELTYTIEVRNIGQTTAEDVVLSDPLPAGVTFLSAASTQGSCEFASGVVTCSLGEILPGAFATATIQARADIGIGTLVNTATANTSTPDSDLSNNSSTAKTLVAPGATRTIGFYGSHPEFVAWCLDVNGGLVELGFTRIANETADDQIDRDRDRDVETGLELGMGILNANVARYVDKTKRSPLAQARMQAGQQVFAAVCNATLLGGEPGFDLAGAPAILAGTDTAAILALGARADAFNNSGDAIALGVPTGKATPKYPWDDPTDPAD